MALGNHRTVNAASDEEIRAALRQRWNFRINQINVDYCGTNRLSTIT
jgi:hypothetical protein